MTDEETKTFVDAKVKTHNFAPKHPRPNVKIDPKTRQYFVEMLERPQYHVDNRQSH
jgi:hypothetical protein